MKKEKKSLGLYFHIPFCVRKCAYCDFYSFSPEKEEEDFVANYVSAMMLQMEDAHDSCRDYIVDTIYFGGGTPSLMPIKQFERIFNSIKHNFRIAKDTEITVEVNPATANVKYLRALRHLGANRLSIGLQSANDAELKLLGRIHSLKEFENTFEDARDAGFKNISVDIMYGIPNQTPESLRSTIEYVTSIRPEHISMYNLKLEEGTPLWKMRDSLILPDEDTEYNMYTSSVEYLASQGFERYEISNFSLKGNVSRHNCRYWNCDEYLGIGASAHSYFGGERYSMIRNASRYIDGLQILDAGIKIIDESRIISKRESMNEYIMLRMRLDEGIDGDVFREKYGIDFGEKFGKYLDEYIPDGFVRRIGNRYSFTTKGMFVSNYILSAVLDFTPEFSFNV